MCRLRPLAGLAWLFLRQRQSLLQVPFHPHGKGVEGDTELFRPEPVGDGLATALRVSAMSVMSDTPDLLG